MLTLKRFTFNPFQENTYLLYTPTGETLIIDPGMHNVEEYLIMKDFLEKNQLTPVRIINTHAHIDHIWGINWLKRHYNIPFGLHQKELPVLESASQTALLFGLELDEVPKPDFYIKEGENFRFGECEFSPIFTPGHSPGSLSYYCPEMNLVLAGDVLFKQGIGRTDLPGGNYTEIVDSIENKLYHLPKETAVFSGHGPETTIGAEIEDGYLTRI